jgi:hypothetical protein
LPSSSTCKRHRVNATLSIPWVLRLYDAPNAAESLNSPYDFEEKLSCA